MMGLEIQSLNMLDEDSLYLPSFQACLLKLFYEICLPEETIIIPGDWMKIKIEPAECNKLFSLDTQRLQLLMNDRVQTIMIMICLLESFKIIERLPH